jgi:6-pyruvoyl-tetrahydropterin synthase
VKTQFEAVHKYPTAPQEVKHLRNLHRHTFIVTVQIEVKHDNRELEFFMVKDFLHQKVQCNLGHNLNYKSCEMINDFFYKHLVGKYGKRKMIIETSEDGQRSAITYYNFTKGKSSEQ